MMAHDVGFATQEERLLARLAEPRTVDALERLLDKVDVVAFGVEALDGFLRRSEEVANSLAESIQEMKKLNNSDSTGSDFVQSLPQLARAGTQLAAATRKAGFQNLLESGLIDQLGDPQTIANIQTVLGKLEVAAFALTAIDGFIKRGDEITDSVGESMHEVRTLLGAIDFKKFEAIPKLLDSGVLDKLPQLTETALMLINSGLLRPDVVRAVTEVGETLTNSYHEAKGVPPQKTTLFGLLKALRDPDVNRSVTLLLEVSRKYGTKLR